MAGLQNGLTQNKLHSTLRYDLHTGVFTWAYTRGPRALAGTIAGTIFKNGYRRIKIDGVSYLEHRLAWLYVHGDESIPEVIDHINRITNDNRIENLRASTPLANSHNVGFDARNTSGHKGVSWCSRDKKWRALIVADGKSYRLGRFETIERASVSYRIAEHFRSIYGDLSNAAITKSF